MTTHRPRWARLLPVVAAGVALGAGAFVVAAPWSSGSGRGRRPAAGAVPADAVEVSSDAPVRTTLEDLVASSEVVVRGTVVETERGRWFGDEGSSSRLQSRLVTLQVDDVLVGQARSATLLVEEEGWLADGSLLVVDGAAPSRTGDEGIWFLVDGGDPQVGAYVVVSAQGRYTLTDADGSLAGPEGDDPLVASLSGSTIDDLAAEIRAG